MRTFYSKACGKYPVGAKPARWFHSFSIKNPKCKKMQSMAGLYRVHPGTKGFMWRSTMMGDKDTYKRFQILGDDQIRTGILVTQSKSKL